MKVILNAVLAASLALTGSVAFAQASGAMAHDTMGNSAMSKEHMGKTDSMSKGAANTGAMSHDSMGKSGNMTGHDSMGKPASGAMAK
jgi:pentapeptide MXKDX repeat protein